MAEWVADGLDSGWLTAAGMALSDRLEVTGRAAGGSCPTGCPTSLSIMPARSQHAPRQSLSPRSPPVMHTGSNKGR